VTKTEKYERGRILTTKDLTVGDLAALIESREEMRAELTLLAVRAHDQCCELEERLQALERRLDQSFEDITRVRLVEGRDSAVQTRAGEQLKR
jgi:hypothetical protein